MCSKIGFVFQVNLISLIELEVYYERIRMKPIVVQCLGNR